MAGTLSRSHVCQGGGPGGGCLAAGSTLWHPMCPDGHGWQGQSSKAGDQDLGLSPGTDSRAWFSAVPCSCLTKAGGWQVLPRCREAGDCHPGGDQMGSPPAYSTTVLYEVPWDQQQPSRERRSLVCRPGRRAAAKDLGAASATLSITPKERSAPELTVGATGTPSRPQVWGPACGRGSLRLQAPPFCGYWEGWALR